jgi:hypothetical protein
MLALGAACVPAVARPRAAARREAGRQAAVAPGAARPLRPAASGLAQLRHAASTTGARLCGPAGRPAAPPPAPCCYN